MYKKVIASLYIVGVLILCMNLYTNYTEYVNNKKVTNMQLLGLTELDKLYKINISLKTYRGLKQHKIQPENRIEEESLKISYLLTKINDKKLEKEISSLLLKDEFYSFNNTINKIELKIIDIGKTYRLFEKLDKKDYSIISSIVYTLPQLIESIGAIRGTGTYYLSHNTITKTEKHLLNSIFDKFILYEQTLLLNDEESELIEVSINRIKLHLEKIQSDNLEIDPIEYFEDLTILINQLNNYYISSEQNVKLHLS
ncbi:hypothetical protein OAR97_05045, partial [Arcobacteraceae bacterium]|nr:hypothetical protein [Arcobacteraceae bacterium]